MAVNVWSVYCTQAVVDRDSGHLSLITVIEAIEAKIPPSHAGRAEHSPQEPMLIPQRGELVTFWTRSEMKTPEVQRARLLLLSPSGDEIGEPNDFQINLREHKRSRLRIKMDGLPVVGNGFHTFSINVEFEGKGWVEVARVPVEVTLESDPEARVEQRTT